MARKDLSEMAPFLVTLAVMILLATFANSMVRGQNQDPYPGGGMEVSSFEQASLDVAWELSRR